MSKEKNDFDKVAREIAETVKLKQESYGDSFSKSQVVVRELYPDGVPVEAYGDFLTIIRIIDKLFRIATAKGKEDLMNENPFVDIMGYSLLAIVKKKRGNRND